MVNSYPQPFCPQCRNPLRLNMEENQWFCDNCKSQVDVLPLSQVSLRGTKEGKSEFSERFILMVIIIVVLSVLMPLIFYLFTLSRL